MQALYTAIATAVGGRNGNIKSSDGVLDHKLAYPKELGGPGGAADLLSLGEEQRQKGSQLPGR
jgi:organic hydroperoxide reductase OsmC/OhrA